MRFVEGCWTRREAYKNHQTSMHSFVFWLFAVAVQANIIGNKGCWLYGDYINGVPNVKDPVSCAMTCESALVSDRKMGCVSLNTSCKGQTLRKFWCFVGESIPNLPDNSGLRLRNILSIVSFGRRWTESCQLLIYIVGSYFFHGAEGGGCFQTVLVELVVVCI